MRKLKIRGASLLASPPENYLTRVYRTPLISIDETKELAERIRQGGAEGERAQEQLAKAHLRFVVSIAKSYQDQGLSAADLIKAGNNALYRAAGKYAQMSRDKEGYSFLAYAVWWIRQGIVQAVAKKKQSV